jgi:hypothetical protein
LAGLRGVIRRLTRAADHSPRFFVILRTFASGGTERYVYTFSGLLISSATIIDPLGHTMTKRFNGAGYVIEGALICGDTWRHKRAQGKC